MSYKSNKSKVFKTRKWIMACCGFMILSAGLLYVSISSVQLMRIGYRNKVSIAIDNQLKAWIIDECQSMNDIDEIIRKCNDIVCRKLTFTYKNDLANGKANCVGYAQMSAATLNYAFKLNSLPYKAKHVYGKAYLWGMDLHPIMKSLVPDKYTSFFNDHDFVEIDCGDIIIYTDSSIQDLSGCEYLRRNYK